MEIVPGVHLIPDIVANPYLLLDADGLTLIDAGLPGSERKILRYITGLGFTPRDLKGIIITHSDTDHVGGLAALQRASGARVFASSVEAAAIRQGAPSRRTRPGKLWLRLLLGASRLLMKARPAHVDAMLTDGQVLPVLGGLHVVDTPGHTPGHISLYLPSRGVLFAGDSIVSREQGLVQSLPALTWNAGLAAASVRKQAALRPEIVCSGHGPVVMDAADKMPVA